MKTKISSPLGLDPMGIGPRLFKNILPLLIAGIVGKILIPEIVSYPAFSRQYLLVPGLVWLCTGILIYILAARKLFVDFPKGKLMTTGVYALSRNPLYASWVVFILPGLSLVANNWIFLTTALFMFFLLVHMIKEEEQALIQLFGKEYENYSRRVPRVGFYVKSFKNQNHA